jgi:hypothetical protein
MIDCWDLFVPLNILFFKYNGIMIFFQAFLLTRITIFLQIFIFILIFNNILVLTLSRILDSSLRNHTLYYIFIFMNFGLQVFLE